MDARQPRTRVHAAAVLACLVSFIAQPSASAQAGSISGSVIDAVTRGPLEGATVSLDGTALSATSTPRGTFSLIGIEPGVYDVVVRRAGFTTQVLRGVDVRTGQARIASFELRRSGGVDSVDVRDDVTPFIDPRAATALLSLSSREVVTLPSLTLAGMLGINGGYVELPRSAATLSASDISRGLWNLPSVRGARSEATQYLLDGIVVTNPVFGSGPVLLEPLAASGVSFSPGLVRAEVGGALSGVVTQAIREGTSRLSGAAEFNTTAIASSAMGGATAANRAHGLRGFLAGPLPFTNEEVRFSVAGHLIGDHVAAFRARDGAWRTAGSHSHDQIVSKLSYAPTPGVRLSLAGVAQWRSADAAVPGFLRGDTVAPASVRDDALIGIARAEKRFNRANISIAVARLDMERTTCSLWQGVCIEDRLQRLPIGAEVPAFGIPPRGTPYAVSGQYFGGESYRTNVARVDAVLQASDHNQVRFGFYAARHDITYGDAIGSAWEQGVVRTTRDVYRARPLEVASYVQNTVEHDLITLHLGVRVDHGRTGGRAFARPLDPTNGTTAFEVCTGRAPGLSETPFRYGDQVGLLACLDSPPNADGYPVLLDSARRLAQRDDFIRVKPRAAFSPRIGISLPITEDAGMFFNLGRQSRHPVYHHAFRNFGRGSRAGMDPNDDRVCEERYRMPGTDECTPNVTLDPDLPEFTGNPDLTFEVANGWEAGFTSRLGARHSIDATVFSNDLSGLPTVHALRGVPDLGLTYGPVGDRVIRSVFSSGSMSIFGIAATVRRRFDGPLAYTLNYTWIRSSEIGAQPDLVAEALATPGQNFDNAIERLIARNRPHSFNGSVSLQWRDAPPVLGVVGSAVLRHSRTVATISMATGSQSRLRGQAGDCGITAPCPRLGNRVSGGETLIDLMYSRALTVMPPTWSFVLRVRNLLDNDDGSAAVVSRNAARGAPGALQGGVTPRISLRRFLTGISVGF
jgi:outer membrane receptor protein involved in Fe transport